MSNQNFINFPGLAQSKASRQAEQIRSFLTLYWNENGTCDAEQLEFRVAIRKIEEITKHEDDATYEHLYLTMLRQWYREVTGRDWSAQNV